MANKTTGQWVGAIVGAVVGYFTGGVGYVALGAAVGGAAGGAIDPPKGPDIIGPRLSDLSAQTSTYGAPIPRVYGMVALNGNVFWLENNSLKEVETSESQGGKGGGGGAEVTTFAYYATFAVGLCRGPIAGVRRIWARNKLIYDAGSNDLAAVVASNRAAEGFSIYTGTETQNPDYRIQADMGVANTPAYRGLAYIVFRDFALADYGNSLLGADIKVEIYQSASLVALEQVGERSFKSNGGDFVAIVQAQNMGGPENYIFAFADPSHSGFPASVTLPWIIAGAFPEPVVKADYIASWGSYGTVLRNNSPFFRGPITKDFDHYYVGGAPYPILYGYQFGGSVWYEEGAGIVGVSLNLGGNDSLIRMAPGGAVQATEFRAYGHEEAIVFERGEFIYVIDFDKLHIFEIDTLALISSELHSHSGVSSNWSVSVGDDGRVYQTSDTSLTGIHRLSPDLKSFDEYYSTGYYHIGVAVSDGVIYGATVTPGTQDIVIRAWRRDIDVPGTASLTSIIESECLLSGVLDSGDIDASGISQSVRGFRLARTAAIRSAFDPLQGAWPFDVLQSGYQIKFVERGNSPVATIDISELGVVATGEKKPIRLSHSREMDTQLPRRVDVNYLDINREYDMGEQGAERLNTDAVNVRKIELALVMNATEAAGVAETLLYLYWLERHDLDFTIPPNYGYLEPADVIVVNGDSATYELRLTSISYLPDGRIECSAKFNNSAIYTPTAQGEESQSTGQTLSLTGGSMMVPLDIPVLIDGMDSPGFVLAAGGYMDGWKGATVLRSDDAGQTWSVIQGFTAPSATIGYTTAPLGGGRTDIKDVSSQLSIRLYCGALYSVTEAQMLNGANHFAIGADGRWEIVAAQHCVEQDDGSWIISDLLRGRFGSEWAISTHALGDAVVLLSSSELKFVTASLNSIGLSRTFRAVTLGQTVDTASDVVFAYAATNLECLAPCYLNGHINQASHDWSLTWIRRTRVGGEWRDLVDAALGEAAESYEVEVWDSSFTTLKRTISGLSSAAASYTSAQQVADFGSEQTTLNLRIYQLSANAGRGYPLQKSITRGNYLLTDPNFSYLVLGLHMDGTNGSTTFTDIKGKTVTASGSAQISTDQYVFGGACGLFNGSGSYLSTPIHTDFQFGTGNFTISAWVRPANVTGYKTIFGGREGYYEFWFGLDGAQIACSFPYGGGGATTTGTPMVANSWYYVEVCRSSGTVYLFIDGVLRGTVFMADSIVYTDAIHIGRINYTGGFQYMNGNLDDLRVYKGVAVHTAGYSIPSEAFPNS